MDGIDTILEFWFGTNSNDAAVVGERSFLWWSKDPEVDREIRERFEPLVLAAASGGLDAWRASIRGRLALILLTDQFPRNIYRGTPQAFRFDDAARQLCLESIQTRAERGLRFIHRVFFYLPLEHSEDLDHQGRGVGLFEELVAEVPRELAPAFREFLEFARKHRAVIERFGRFPHRNAILGRESTREEIEFLKQPGSSF